MALRSPRPGSSAFVPFFVLLGTVRLADPDFDTRGVVRFSGEDGRWAIDAGEDHLEPINLPVEFRIDGLRVSFEANDRDDLSGSGTKGRVVELEYIQMAA
jgi:hypothetical protein